MELCCALWVFIPHQLVDLPGDTDTCTAAWAGIEYQQPGEA